jgi:hypothetical protein
MFRRILTRIYSRIRQSNGEFYVKGWTKFGTFHEGPENDFIIKFWNDETHEYTYIIHDQDDLEVVDYDRDDGVEY